MRNIILLVLLSSFCSRLASQDVRLEIPDTLLTTGEGVTLPVEAYGFESVASFQFAVSWDSTLVLQQADFLSTLESGLAFVEFDDHIRVSWLGVATGLNLPDGTALLELTFDPRACPGDTARVRLAEELLPTEVGVIDTGLLDLITPDTFPNLTTWRAPDILPFRDTLICAGEELAVTAGCEDCETVEWEAGMEGGTLTIDSAGLYPVLAVSEDACAFQDTLAVEVDTFRMQSLRDTILCPEDDIRLAVVDTFPAYRWSTGATAASITVSEGGQYTLSITNANGCTAIDSAEVNALPLPMGIPFAAPPRFCPGDSVQLTLDTVAVDSVQWLTVAGEVLAADSVNLEVRPDSSASYTAISQNGCGVDTATVQVEQIKFEASAGRDTCIAEGASLQLSASGGEAYEWQQREYPVNPADIPDPMVQPADSTWYVVEITGPEGCTLLDSVFVEVATNPLASIPAIELITPNGDGKNDVLFFPNLGKFPGNTLTVWNRWGQAVYQKSGYQTDEERWAGDRNGQPLPDGEYYYLLEVDGVRIQQTLSIIRE